MVPPARGAPSESPAYYKKEQPTYYSAIFTFPVTGGNYGPFLADRVARKYSTGPGLAVGCTSGNGALSEIEASPTATLTTYAARAIGNWTQASVTVNVTYGPKKGRK